MTPAYILIRSARRTISLSVGKDGRAVLRAPLTYPRGETDAFVAKHAQWLEKQKSRIAALPDPPTDEQIRQKKQRLSQRLEPILARYSQLTGLVPTGVKYTAAQKRYGSCSPKNSLCFSYILADMDDEAIEAVVLHELAHIRYKNHGRQFYEYIYRYMPDYPRRRALLKNGGRKDETV